MAYIRSSSPVDFEDALLPIAKLALNGAGFSRQHCRPVGWNSCCAEERCSGAVFWLPQIHWILRTNCIFLTGFLAFASSGTDNFGTSHHLLQKDVAPQLQSQLGTLLRLAKHVAEERTLAEGVIESDMRMW